MNFIRSYFYTKLQNDIYNANSYINMHDQESLEHYAQNISEISKLKLRVITGYIWGISSVKFDEQSGARVCQRTSMSYTLDVMKMENTKLKELRESFFQDYRSLTGLEDAVALHESLNELKVTSEKILKCLHCVLKSYKIANKEKNQASIPALEDAIRTYATEIEELTKLLNFAAFAKQEYASEQSGIVNDPSEAIQIFDTQSNNWMINQDQERAVFQKRLAKSLNVGDLERSKVVIAGEAFDQLHLEEKSARLLAFANNNPHLKENIIKLASQALSGASGVPMTTDYGNQGYVMTSDGENVEKGLKKIEIERVGNDLKITMKGVFSYSHMTDTTTPLIVIDQTVVATIPENDLLEGRSDRLFLENTFVRRA